MTALQSIFLGVVQGLTEFLPVSSSGHLAILQGLFHIQTDGGLFFDILLHLGTLAVIFVVYRKDIWSMICEGIFLIGDLFRNFYVFLRNKITGSSLQYCKVISNSYRKFVLLVLVSTIPTALLGILLKDLVTEASKILLIPGICLLITAVLLLMADTVEEGHKKPLSVSYRSALIIGTAQGFATLPGLSRSGTTIAACLLCGIDRSFAVKYSFILSVPAILGAVVLEIPDVILSPPGLGQFGIYFLGVISAFVVGYLCIRILLAAVRNKKFYYFSGYCAVIGLLAIAGQFFL